MGPLARRLKLYYLRPVRPQRQLCERQLPPFYTSASEGSHDFSYEIWFIYPRTSFGPRTNWFSSCRSDGWNILLGASEFDDFLLLQINLFLWHGWRVLKCCVHAWLNSSGNLSGHCSLGVILVRSRIIGSVKTLKGNTRTYGTCASIFWGIFNYLPYARSWEWRVDQAQLQLKPTDAWMDYCISAGRVRQCIPSILLYG